MTDEQRSPPRFPFFRRVGLWLTFGKQMRALQERLDLLEQEHRGTVAWLQKTYPEIVDAIGRKLEESHLDQLAQNLFSAIHRETGVLEDRLKKVERSDSGTESARSAMNDEDSRSRAFYLDLERCFRGTESEIAERGLYYLPILETDRETQSPVLDIGCGRGEWLRMLSERGIPASGVDMNPINGDYCRSKGLAVTTGDALDYLATIPDDSIGTVSAFHLVEHLQFSDLLSLTDEILRVLKPGGLLIYETPNPENILVSTHSFWIDPTHVRPLPPELLRFLVTQRGFTRDSIHRLHPDTSISCSDKTVQALLGCPRDYSVVAHKPYPG